MIETPYDKPVTTVCQVQLHLNIKSVSPDNGGIIPLGSSGVIADRWRESERMPTPGQNISQP
jgi:hypothetical protein